LPAFFTDERAFLFIGLEMIRAGGQGPGSAGVFSTLSISRSSSTRSSGTFLFAQADVTTNPSGQSSAVTIPVLGKVTYTGTGGFDAIGHNIGTMGYALMNSSGETASLLIGAEGKTEVTAGTVTNLVAVQGGLANVGASGTVGTLANFNASISGNSGTISNVNYFRANAFSGTAPANVIGFNMLNQAGSSSTIGFYGQLTAGTGKFNIAIPSGGAPVVIGASANSGNSTILQVTGGAEILSDRGVRYTNQTSSAGAATATLTNSPAAGNPAFWLRVVVNGSNGAIPVWLG
jgi:hypothetical protein